MKRIVFIVLVFVSFSVSAQWPNQGQSSRPTQEKEKTNTEPASTVETAPSQSPKTTLQKDPEKKGFRKENLFFGGGLGASFGSMTYVELSPMVGYKFHRMFRAAISLRYTYYKDNRSLISYEASIVGGSLYVRFYPIRYLFVHAEIQGLNHPDFSAFYYDSKDRIWAAYPLVGLGANLPLGSKSALNISCLWNLNSQAYSIYNNPIFQIGFDIGL